MTTPPQANIICAARSSWIIPENNWNCTGVRRQHTQDTTRNADASISIHCEFPFIKTANKQKTDAYLARGQRRASMAREVPSMWLIAPAARVHSHSFSTHRAPAMSAPMLYLRASAYFQRSRSDGAFPNGHYFSCRSIVFRWLWKVWDMDVRTALPEFALHISCKYTYGPTHHYLEHFYSHPFWQCLGNFGNALVSSSIP